MSGRCFDSSIIALFRRFRLAAQGTLRPWRPGNTFQTDCFVRFATGVCAMHNVDNILPGHARTARPCLLRLDALSPLVPSKNGRIAGTNDDTSETSMPRIVHFEEPLFLSATIRSCPKNEFRSGLSSSQTRNSNSSQTEARGGTYVSQG
jgi:hypothetical protein